MRSGKVLSRRHGSKSTYHADLLMVRQRDQVHHIKERIVRTTKSDVRPHQWFKKKRSNRKNGKSGVTPTSYIKEER